MRRITILMVTVLATINLFGQQAYYDVSPGNGLGIRFWSNDNYKIHMGSAPNYRYGPVTDYSIKMNMNDNTARGWTWGVVGQTPIAALNTQGVFQLASDLRVFGNIGVGTSDPNYLFEVEGIGESLVYFNAKYSDNHPHRIQFGLQEYDGYISLWDGNDNKTVHIWGGGDSYFNGGNVGIGTTNPTYLLSVKGTIGCGEIKVEDVTGWADFVFEDDYNLMPLQELDTYIQENKHLPEIPTTEEVEENGISVGEMNAKLLQKIEELTLYIIEQDKKIEKQNKRIDQLENLPADRQDK